MDSTQRLTNSTMGTQAVVSCTSVGLIMASSGSRDYSLKYEKHFQKMYRDVGMAVPKTTETRCRDGSVQARHVIQRLHN